MSEAKYYEAGMKISYDQKSQAVSITFRGKIVVLAGPYATLEDATKAGENHCRLQGWRGGRLTPAAAGASCRPEQPAKRCCKALRMRAKLPTV